MLEAAGGGGGTPWESLTVQQMQDLIQSADTDKQWDIVGGWQKSAELISEHRFQVQDYRDNLAAAWPPKKNAAAAAYLDRLDELIANLTQTYEAALANHDAFSAATGSIYLAQTQMHKLYREYTQNEQLLAQSTAGQSSSSGTTPTPSPSPSGEEPLVAPGRQEALRHQAVTLLSSVSSDLAAAQLRIVKPPIYRPLPSSDEKARANDGTTYVAPALPPITPSYADNKPTTSSRAAATFPTTPAATSPATTPPATGSQPGLVLGGTTTPIATPPKVGTSMPIPGGSAGLIGGPGFVPSNSGFISGGSPVRPPSGTSVGSGLGPRESIVRPGIPTPEGMRAIPPSGIIGGTPGLGVGQPGRVGTSRVNPVGGVIGGGAGTHGAGARSTLSEPYGQTGGRRSGRRSEPGPDRWDPNNPWETAKGVEPVVLPAREQRIDPGPAIGIG